MYVANEHEGCCPFLRITAHVSGKSSFLVTFFKILFFSLQILLWEAKTNQWMKHKKCLKEVYLQNIEISKEGFSRNWFLFWLLSIF